MASHLRLCDDTNQITSAKGQRSSLCYHLLSCCLKNVLYPIRHRDGHPGNAYSQKTVCVFSTSTDHSFHRSFLWCMAFVCLCAVTLKNHRRSMLCHIIPERTTIVSPRHKNNNSLAMVLRGNDIIHLITSQTRLRRGR